MPILGGLRRFWVARRAPLGGPAYAERVIGAGLGISTKLSVEAAADCAVRAALDGLVADSPSAALVFATDAWGAALPDVVSAVADRLPIPVTGGGSVEAIWTARQGTSRNPAVAVLVMAGVGVESALLDGISGEEIHAGEDLLAHLAASESESDLLFLLMDSESLLPQPLMAGVTTELGSGSLSVAGLGLSAVRGGSCLAWRDRELRSGAVLGLRFGARSRICVAAACRVLPHPLNITRARGNWILGLEGRPAHEVYCDLVRELDLGDPALAVRHLSVVTSNKNANEVANPQGSPGGRLRKLVGIDPERGAISLPEPVQSGDVLRFALHDEVGARENLERVLDSSAKRQPAFGFFTTASLHGRSPFGGIDREARALAERFPGVPILGLHGAFQLAAGPEVEPDAQVLTHVGLLTLIDH